MPFVTYFPGRGSYREEAYLEGKAAGRAEAGAQIQAEWILGALEGGGFPVPESVREGVASCVDSETLGRWIDLALTAAGVKEPSGPDMDSDTAAEEPTQR
ncbi:hypothetical protein ACFVTY_28925 [Streptomyces sp. NPDC058067]|uniref:hypothetical protein n=1 Tax=Streptomyces sp. NPDC058067 TaxID=3346324 RepID=UPI0036DFE37C